MRREQRERDAFALAAAYATSASPTAPRCSFRPSSPAARRTRSGGASWRPTSARSAASHYRLASGQRGATGWTDFSATHARDGRMGEDNACGVLGTDFRRRCGRRRAIAGMTHGAEAAALTGVVDYETLQDENLKLKLALNQATEENKRYSTNRTRLERELLRLDGKVEMLLTELEQPPGHRDQRVLDHARREVEKCAVVRSLAQQKEHLQQWLARRERELEALKRTQEWSAVAEMAAATEDYFLEIQRLRRLLVKRQHVDENSPSAYCPDEVDEWKDGEGGQTIVREEYTPSSSRQARSSANKPMWERRRLLLTTTSHPSGLRGAARGLQPRSTDVEIIARDGDYQDTKHPIESCSRHRRRSRQSVNERTATTTLASPRDGFHEIRTSDGSRRRPRPPSPVRRGSPPHPARMAARAASREIALAPPTSPLGTWRSQSDREGVGSLGGSGSQGRRSPAVSKGGVTGTPVAKCVASSFSAETRAREVRPSRRSRPMSAPSRRDRTGERPGTVSREDQKMSWGRRSHNALSPGFKRLGNSARERSSSVDVHASDRTVGSAAAASSGTSTSIVVVKQDKGGQFITARTEHTDIDDDHGENHGRYDDGIRAINTPIVGSVRPELLDRRSRGRAASEDMENATMGQRIHSAAPPTLRKSTRHGGQERVCFIGAPINGGEGDRLVSACATPDFDLEGEEISLQERHDVPRSSASDSGCTIVQHCDHDDGERGDEGTTPLTYYVSHMREESQGGRGTDVAESVDHSRMDGSDGGRTPAFVYDNDSDDSNNGRGKSDESVASRTNALILDGSSDCCSEHHHEPNILGSGVSLVKTGERSVASEAPSVREKGVSSTTPAPGRRPHSCASAPYGTSAVSSRERGYIETVPPVMEAGSRDSSYDSESITVQRGGDPGVAASSIHSNISRASTVRSQDGSEIDVDVGADSSVSSQRNTTNNLAARQERPQPRVVAATSHQVHDGGVKRAAIEVGEGGGTGEEIPPELNGRRGSSLDDFNLENTARASTPRGVKDERRHSSQGTEDDDGDPYDMERLLPRESPAEQRPREIKAASQRENSINTSINNNNNSSRRKINLGDIGEYNNKGNGGDVRVNREDDDGDYALSSSTSGVVVDCGVGAAHVDRDAVVAVEPDSSRLVEANIIGVHDPVFSHNNSGDSNSRSLVTTQNQREATLENEDGGSSPAVISDRSEGGDEGFEYGDDFDEEDDD